MTSEPKRFYVYCYCSPLEGTPIYVGKGSGKRVDQHWKMGCPHNKVLDSMLAQYRATGLEPIREIVAWTDSEVVAYALEKELIAKYGRADLGLGTLANQNDGGGGGGGLSLETRSRMSESHRGKPFTSEHRTKLSMVQRGRLFTPEHRAKLSEARAKRITTLETRNRLSASHRDKKFTKEHRENISAALRGNTNNIGRVASLETRAKTSAAHSVGASGIRGIRKQGDKYRAEIGRRYLGTFPTISEAVAAYEAARAELYPESQLSDNG